MKSTGKLALAAVLAATGMMVAVDANAQRGGRGHGAHGQRHGHYGQGHRHGGHSHWRGGGHWGFYFGAPLVFGAASWGWPYYYDDFYRPRGAIIYRDREPYPQSFPEGEIGPVEPSTEIPRGEGTPSQGPLYMNYCESAKAYFPKVTSCPEGWKLATPTG